MRIKIIRGHHKGTMHEARTIPTGILSLPRYQVTEGNLSGAMFDYLDAVVVDEGRTYTEPQYNELAKKVTKLEEDRTYLLKEINALKADKELLLETIAEEERSRKVELPREVSEAIEGALWVHRTKFDLIDSINVALRGGSCDVSVIKISRFIKENKLDKDLLMVALVNGYTVKDEQEKLEEQVYQMIDDWLDKDYHDDVEEDTKIFANKLIELFKQNLQAI